MSESLGIVHSAMNKNAIGIVRSSFFFFFFFFAIVCFCVNCGLVYGRTQPCLVNMDLF